MVKIERIIDRYLFGLLVPILSLFRFFDKKIDEKKNKKILVVKLWAIGDSVLSLALIKALKKTGTVDVLTRKRVIDVYRSYEVNKIYDMDNTKEFLKLLSKGRQYDYVFDLEPYLNLSAIFSFILGKQRVGFSNQWRSMLYNEKIKFRKDQHMVQNYFDMARILGINYDTEKLEKLNVSKKAKKKVDTFLKKIKKLIVGITPGVAESTKTRMWFEERFAETADRIIKELDCDVIFIDGPSNKENVEKIVSMMKEKPINASDKFSLEETFYLISKCDVFISNDTGPMHIAAAQGCKTIGLFGPNTPILWAPYGKGNISIYKTDKPVLIENDKGIFKEGKREEYMGPITVEDVFLAVKKLLNKK